ncbi:hypothetical protein Bca52824_095772 [Brassica carinata]|uniref:Uncharacterized protein n=1 Tax=Brassica carinata TaxID=52824 RepID=A0A8X7P0S0_BRACI|nr:hypothetical protein Bca52824_095772 [Brassica carinata]
MKRAAAYVSVHHRHQWTTIASHHRRLVLHQSPPALIHHHRCEPLVTGVIHVVGEPPTSLTLRTAGVMENVRKDLPCDAFDLPLCAIDERSRSREKP